MLSDIGIYKYKKTFFSQNVILQNTEFTWQNHKLKHTKRMENNSRISGILDSKLSKDFCN